MKHATWLQFGAMIFSYCAPHGLNQKPEVCRGARRIDHKKKYHATDALHSAQTILTSDLMGYPDRNSS